MKKKKSRASYSANGASESASKKLATFCDDPVAEVRRYHIANTTDAAEEASAAVESPTKKSKVVGEESEQQRKQAKKATIKAKKDAEKAEKEA